MVLSTPISQRAVKTDSTVAQFVERASQNPPSREQLNSAKIHYQQKLLLACFDYQALHFSLKKLSKLLSQNLKLIQFSGFEIFETIEKQTLDEIIIVSGKFKRQLQLLFADNKVPEDDAKLQERVQKASHYFSEKLQSGLVEWLAAFNVDSDNKEIKKQINQIQHPRAVISLKIDGNAVPDNTELHTMIFIILYIGIILISTTLLAFLDIDNFTAFTGSVATIGNVGPGFGKVSSLANFASLPDMGKLILSLNMLLGRLYIF